MIDTLDSIYCPLSGINLVEASAGTGKTYAIASIYVRLLVESKLKVNDILVVTYTNAATSELKDRIRTKIKYTLDAFSTGESDDAFIKGLLLKIKDSDLARKHLSDALKDFDQAAIFTIHGFCLRMLREYAFETCSLFDTELAEDNTEFIDEIVKDFWRIHLYYASPLFVNYAIKKINTKKLSALAIRYTGNPFVKIDGGSLYDGGNEENIEKECLDAFNKTRRIWEDSKAYIEDYLRNDNSLNRTTYNKNLVEELILRLNEYFYSGFPVPLPEKFGHLCFNPAVKKALKRNADPPDHPFFKCCGILKQKTDPLIDIYDRKIEHLKKILNEYIMIEARKKKQEKNLRSFDDLLLDLFSALKGKEGKTLAELIKKKHKAILIDEFQDTDPVQYEIFKAVYTTGDCILFIIGDPKQSIYSFRGADIFAYIKAVHDASEHWTLNSNYRASDRLIKAVNTIFGNAINPFVFKNLFFKPVRAANSDKQKDLSVNGVSDTSPFIIWLLQRGSDEKQINVDDARKLLYNTVADEIVRLLTMGDKGEITIDDIPVSSKDIAVLVRTNREAREMLKALNRSNIPGVIYSSENIFTTKEAKEIRYLISAIAEPADESKVKAALVTDMIGITGDELEKIIEDENQWNDYLETFEMYQNLWLANGFMNMARTIIARWKIKARLLKMPEGERRLTNVLHCFELLHKASVRYRLSIEGTLKWLDNKINKESSTDTEEYQIRLETDETAVKIVTIHRSKGLEYPIVFCPFCWNSSETKDGDIIIYHNRADDYCPTIDIKAPPDEAAKRQKELEQLAENVRLFYVAITRAKKRCYLAWGSINKSETSALAYIFHSSDVQSEDFSISVLKDYMKNLSDAYIKSRVEELSSKSDGAIKVMPVPGGQGLSYKPPELKDKTLSPKIFKGTIEKSWHVTSFSSLISGRHQGIELPDRDRSAIEDTHIAAIPSQANLDIFNFPAGTKAGTCLHDIFEHLDLTLKDPRETEKLINETLENYGIEPVWTNTIFKMVENVVKTPIITNSNWLTLSKIDSSQRLNELEFYLPLKLINPAGLEEIFRKDIRQDNLNTFAKLIKDLGFTPVKGMLRGFIDMVFQFEERFYIVDWKSNLLGRKIEDYNQDLLNKVMEDEFYFLQYHLYTVALNNLLSFRDRGYSYERNFGGVCYIFLRGVTPEKGHDYGIFFDRPDEGLIRGLTGYLTGTDQ